MWQIFTLASLVFNAAETTADKVIMVADRTLDTLVTSFYRNFVFVILSLAIGLSGLVGVLQFRLEWPLVLVGALELGTSIFYTILLKKVEMTGAAAFSYITPFLFLLVDVFIIAAPLSISQIIGILLLISGGIIFVVDPLTHRLKSEYTKYIWAILLFNMLAGGAHYYVFKYYAAAGGLNEISYIFNVWSWATVGLLIIVIVGNKWRLLRQTAAHKHYLRKIIISKGFDVIAALFWFRALSLATVSQVNSFAAFNPLILLLVLFIAQQIFRFKADEDFTRTGLFQKTFATAILIIGAWMAS